MASLLSPFPLVRAFGRTPFELGFSQGSLLKDRIAKVSAWYLDDLFQSRWKIPVLDMQRQAEAMREQIRLFDGALMNEIEGVAAGAGVDVWRVLALNCRTEILNRRKNEHKGPPPPPPPSHQNKEKKEEPGSEGCTTIGFPSLSLLCQNWDWDCNLEALLVILKLTRLAPSEGGRLTSQGEEVEVDGDTQELMERGAAAEVVVRQQGRLDPSFASSSHMIEKREDTTEATACLQKWRQRPNPTIIAEPGIIGKMGMNSAGVAVTLNFLSQGRVGDPGAVSVPVHVLLRGALEAPSAAAAQKRMELEGRHREGGGACRRSSNSCIGCVDREGGGWFAEMAGEDVDFLAAWNPETSPAGQHGGGSSTAGNDSHPVLLHTNHYLSKQLLKILEGDEKAQGSQSSQSRMRRAVQKCDSASREGLLKRNQDNGVGPDSGGVDAAASVREFCWELLRERREEDSWPVCREYLPDENGLLAGTVCTVAFDCRSGTLSVCRGNRSGQGDRVSGDGSRAGIQLIMTT
uniref:Uncharacterized protein n=1 Tax=Chromera velia CCMP2878 TaxID=1169474 RepID=A0A0G4G696_9ALVE|eukprot:Cvel_20364.t1-p1 / transcript=Cvel_20364.t1 / gene=Cvel_20364 / organism=Chromera_velia_CCMP2878 / gene_product=hypothetical protein / transcript_product=hypothetical protein / location=Cvel_scaffold1822:1429-8235(-) / protein_length=517 / sequence_SO=supercontig / SO=protein_coding / is_pseudo=false